MSVNDLNVVSMQVSSVHGAEVECVGGVVGVAARKSGDVSPREKSECTRVSRAADLPSSRTQRPRSLHVSLPASGARLDRLIGGQAVRLPVSTTGRMF